MERDGHDAAAAATHDFRFHEELVRHCANEQLLGTLRPLKRRLLRYELAYMAVARNVGRSVAQHAEIVDALERDDREAAAASAEANFRDAMPGLLERIESPR
jgi:DNA-binding GntR family transcriptional regulator